MLRLLTFLLLACVLPAKAAPPAFRKAVELRLLVLATDGKEVGLEAIRSLLDHQGTPYDLVRLAAGEPLPALTEAGRGRYQGIILTIGNLGICDPACHSALTPEGWLRLDNYARDYGVRTLSYYTFPEGRYGLAPVTGIGTSDDQPLRATLTGEGAAVFRDVREGATLTVANAYVYLARMVQEEGEVTTPLVEAGGSVLAAYHRSADGRESIAQTYDNNPNLVHTLALSRGLLEWLTQGVFLGYRKSYLMPQVDDLFLPNALFDRDNPACTASQTVAPDGSVPCARLRISGADLEAVARWQRRRRAQPQFSLFRISLAFNGFGAIRSGAPIADDSLVTAAQALKDEFFWVSHTYTHRHLDCYDAACLGATAEQGIQEITENSTAARLLGLTADPPSLVTPQISGLHNREFLRGAADAGIRYLMSDTSRSDGILPAMPNTGLRSPGEPRILLIPRRPTAIFFNAAHDDAGTPGSEPDEYNYLFGPQGIFRRGGADGPPFFAAEQSYRQIVERESDLILTYLLRGEMYPLMFHQANLFEYRPGSTLLTDVLEAALRKFEALSNLPVHTVEQTLLGQLLEERMTFRDAEVRAVWEPGLGLRLSSRRPAVVPVTGICQEACEQYGPFSISYLPVRPE